MSAISFTEQMTDLEMPTFVAHIASGSEPVEGCCELPAVRRDRGSHQGTRQREVRSSLRQAHCRLQYVPRSGESRFHRHSAPRRVGISKSVICSAKKIALIREYGLHWRLVMRPRAIMNLPQAARSLTCVESDEVLADHHRPPVPPTRPKGACCRPL